MTRSVSAATSACPASTDSAVSPGSIANSAARAANIADTAGEA